MENIYQQGDKMAATIKKEHYQLENKQTSGIT